jgi:cytochrome c oxidase subunit 4
MPQDTATIPQHTISTRTYVIVCGLLILLTVLTVGFSFASVPPFWHMLIGMLIALCKASLVVLFFMHALISPRLTWVVIAIVSFWLGILLVLTLTDYFTRGMIPGMPGH